MKTITLPDGTELAAIGQGTWYMGDDESTRHDEIQALRTGLDQELQVIDTAEMYGDGRSERLVQEAIANRREKVFLVSKVLPSHAAFDDVLAACDRSLERLGTDYLDLYLLHWRGAVPLGETVAAFEQLKEEGKIKHWGVSNFDTDDMEELWSVKNGQNCAVNQVLYNLTARGIEYDLLPWQKEKGIPIMAYCPLAQGDRKEILHNAAVRDLAKAYGVSVSQIALAWTIQSGHVLSIPKAGQAAHVVENAEAGNLVLNKEDLAKLDKEFPPPMSKVPLEVV
ncbi:aldo/keto reductase [Terribacillus saccharophilus]|uniref:aldo/keto reductase n=1 Tax=Terribacillus saccharophilus TaxID=361277 RepID=UPI002DC185A1|nr:aldo/keto reductase [Terribacillus saccharophilus]MEC0289871.1 aldo/keto reductase [Terribacillus saccharophilus]